MQLETPTLQKSPLFDTNLTISTTTGIPLKKISLFNGQIVLNEDITKVNYFCAQFQTLLMFMIFTATDTLQPMVLIDSDTYNIDKASAGTINAQILMYDLPARLVLAPLYGTLSDILGRRIMLIYSLVCVFIGYLITPLGKEIYPWYILSRLLIVNGSVCMLIVPLNADYIDNATKGRAAGISYTFGATGALISAATIGLLGVSGMGLSEVYWVLAFLILVIGFLNVMGLKGGNQYYRSKEDKTPSSAQVGAIVKEQTLFNKIKLASLEIDRNPWIIISFILSSLGSADFYIFTTIFVLYLKSFYPNTPKFEKIANAKANFYQSIFFSVCLVCCVVYGFLIDRISHIKLLLSILLLTTIGFALVPFVQTPDDLTLRLMIFITSIGLPGVFTFANYSVIRYFPPEHRGTLNGFVGVFGVFGIVLVMFGGGFLFDYWHRSGPFLLYDVMLGLSTIAIVWMYFFRIRGTKFDASPDGNREGSELSRLQEGRE